MTIANVKAMVAKSMMVGLAAGTLMIAAPTAHAQNFAVGVQFGSPNYRYDQRARFEFERRQEFLRQQELERREAFFRHEQFQREHRFDRRDDRSFDRRDDHRDGYR